MNVWTVRHINPGTGNPCLLSTAGFVPQLVQPTGIFNVLDGVVMRADVFGDNTVIGNNFHLYDDPPVLDQGKIFAHEVGHYLDMLHTFHPNNNPQLPQVCAGVDPANTPNTGCNIAGDRMCDTPPIWFTQSLLCQSTTQNCGFPDQFENYMSYSNDNCINTFTHDQCAWMRGALNNQNLNRFSLWQPANLAATGINNNQGTCVGAYYIHVSPSSPCPGTTVTFTAIPTSCNSCATAFQWTTPGASVASSNQQSFQSVYAQSGIYPVTLTISDGTIQTAFTIPVTIAPSFEARIINDNQVVTTCINSLNSVEFEFIGGMPPFNITLSNGVNFETNLRRYNHIINIPASTTISITQASDRNCDGRRLGAIQYTALGCCTNELVNGNFNSIDYNTFDTDLCTQPPCVPHGSAQIINSNLLQDFGNELNIDGPYPPYGIHPGAGMNPIDPTFSNIWCQQIDLIENEDYELYFLVTNVNNSCVGASGGLHAFDPPLNLELVILNAGVVEWSSGTVIPEMAISRISTFGYEFWCGFNFIIQNQLPDGNYMLCLRQVNNFDNTYFDFAVDEFSFRRIINEPLTITPSATHVCSGSAVTLTASGGTTYEWFDEDGNLLSDDEELIDNPTQTTTYTLVADASAGCPRVTSVTIYVLTVEIESNASYCAAEATAIASDGTPPYQFIWSGGQTTPTVTGLTAGIYTVDVTDDNNCAASADVTVTVINEVILSNSATNVSCNGNDDGAIDLTVTGDASPYAYNWSNSETTQDIAGLTAGTYSVTVTGSNECTATTNVTITEPDELILSTSITNIGCGGSTTGEIDLTVTGGITPYAYAWSNSATDQDLNGLSAGTYTVTVTDANSCTATTDATVVACATGVTNIPTGTTTWSGLHTFCDDLIIPAHAILQLDNARLEFARFNSSNQPVNLIIQPGGMLRMSASVLTNLSGCDEMWHGVIVLAIPNATSNFNDNGAIIALDINQTFCEISNAENGIITQTTGTGSFSYLQGGGILQLQNVNFINNRAGIALFRAFYSTGFIRFCNFTCDNNFLQPDVNGNTLIAHIGMIGAGFMPTWSCTFDNATVSTDPDYFRGVGIYAVQSRGVLVSASSFENMNYGAFILDGSFLNYIGNGCQFTDNDYGIRAIGASNLYIAGSDINNPNIFNVPDAPGRVAPDFDVAGIHVENSTGLYAYYNRFVGSATSACGSGPCSYGIVTDNTGQAGGRIFQNDFYGTHFGLQTEGLNPELSIRCNNFEIDATDPFNIVTDAHPDHAWSSLATETSTRVICINLPPIICITTNQWGDLRTQGYPSCNTDPQRAAGNHWLTNTETDPANINCFGRDKDIFAEPIVPFYYYHHREDIGGELTVKPECATSWWHVFKLRKACALEEFGTSCDESTIAFRIAPPDSQQNVQEYIDTLAAMKNDYLTVMEQKQNDMDSLNSLLDNGDTEALLDSILNQSHSALKKDTILKRNSPLSDDVLLAAMLGNVYHQHPLFYEDELRDLLVTNVPLSKKTIQVMPLYMDEEHTDSVLRANAEGPFDSLRIFYTNAFEEWKYYDSEIKLADNGLRFAYGYLDALDTTGASRQYETYLRNTYTSTSKKLLAELLLQKEELEEAEAVLDTVWMLSEPEDSLETSWFANYTELMIELAQQEGGILNMDSAQKAQMYSIAESGAHVAPKAHAVLYLVDTTAFEYPIEKIESEPAPKTSFVEKEHEKIIPEANEQIHFRLYPNPNEGTMTLEYKLKDEPGRFVLYNISGKQVAEIFLEEGQHKKIVEPNIENGFYVVRVLQKSEQIYIGKLIIIK